MTLPTRIPHRSLSANQSFPDWDKGRTLQGRLILSNDPPRPEGLSNWTEATILGKHNLKSVEARYHYKRSPLPT